MMKQKSLTLILLMALLLIIGSLGFAGLPEKDKAQGVQKTTTNDLYRPFLINNVFNYYSNNGDGSFNKFSTDNEGFEFLKGDGKNIFFEDGVVWGGFHKGRTTPTVGGSVYRHGLQAGPILTPGTATTNPVADDASLTKNRIFRVRPDINPSVDFSAVEDKINAEEVAFIGRFESFTAKDIYDQYIKDWNEWPGDLGAPYIDVDSNHVYNPAIDIPGQPGADQTLWYVSNDMSAARTNNLSGSPPIGLEMQRTIWGYRRAGALGTTIFASSILINKSGAKIDSMYLVQWSDPDLGDAGDDFVGCDVPRSLGFVYNGKDVDATFGSAVPAGGFDFFQGPIVASAPTDSAIFKLKYRYGYKNLKMSAFVFFTQGNAAFADPTQGTGGDIQWYRLMNGFIAASGNPFIDPVTGLPTKFCLSGDPVVSTTGSAGWVDGLGGLSPADRRMCMVTGPFTMAVGDTQELVVGTMGAVGTDRLSSITELRRVDDQAQQAYDGLFSLASPPPAPVVQVAILDGEIVLNWGDPKTADKTESYESKGFHFEGYKVYELPTASDARPILLAEYDLRNGVKVISDTLRDPSGLEIPTILQRGTDNGIERTYHIKNSKVTGASLVNGSQYFFAVTAYAHNPEPLAADGTHALEDSRAVITVVPHSANPGTRYSQKWGDTLKVTQNAPAAGGAATDGAVIPIVVDPSKLTGDTYRVGFATDTVSGNVMWTLTDVTKNKTFTINNPFNQTGDGDYPIIDGILLKVTGPPPGMKGWAIPTGSRVWTYADATGFGLEGFSSASDTTTQDRTYGSIGNAFDSWFTGGVGYGRLHSVLIKFAAADGSWDPKVAPTDTNFSHAYRYLRSASAAPAKPEFAPWIVNPTAGYAYQDYNYGMPWSAWDVDVKPAKRLAVGHLENNRAGGLVDGKWWPPIGATVHGTGNVDSGGPREWWFIFDSPYTTTPDPALAVDILDVETPMMWLGMTTRRGASISAGNSFLIISNHVNSPANSFNFVANKPTVGDVALAKVDVDKVNVFPNPYIGFNPQERNRYARFVTINHLPTKAVVRVFNLAGVLVRTVMKDNPDQFLTWDLNNQNGFPVSAGMYVLHITMPDLGVTKVLKLGVIPEQQYLDRW